MTNSTKAAGLAAHPRSGVAELSIGAFAALGFIVATTGAIAADCPRPDSLGTARVMALEAQSTPRVGLKSFPQTLPLQDKEVVLTFDDGPNPPTTRRVLAALAHECVRATFFVIGQSAAAHPDLLKAMAAAGHTIGHHSWSHPNLARLSEAAAKDDIARGIAADAAALGSTARREVDGDTRGAPAASFFRFPYFASTPALLRDLESQGMVVFGADLWASDWNTMTPDQEFGLITKRLQTARRGIILFHDSKARTAAMLPHFLRFLRDNDYRIVHVVPRSGESDGG